MSAVTAPLRPSRRAPVEHTSHLRVVDRPVRRHTLAFALLWIVVLGTAVFGAVALNALAAAASVEARALESHVSEAERQHAQLVADVAHLEDPARVRAAAEALGMVPPGPVRHLSLERSLPADSLVPAARTPAAPADPLKPLLSVER
ncbi:MAG: hypothetical protein ACLFUG_09115 [Nitriliruptoraceae bacterium]